MDPSKDSYIAGTGWN